MPKVVIAFLQNTWVKNPEKLSEIYSRHDEEFRIRMIKLLLFSGGSITGKRLVNAFGRNICNQIIWEEGSPLITDNPRQFVPPEDEHIKKALEKYQPDLVISFGKANEKVIQKLWSGDLLILPHPAARQNGTVARLKSASSKIEEALA
jgi:hypothetical protein